MQGRKIDLWDQSERDFSLSRIDAVREVESESDLQNDQNEFFRYF